jgi:hypothetical protein
VSLSIPEAPKHELHRPLVRRDARFWRLGFDSGASRNPIVRSNVITLTISAFGPQTMRYIPRRGYFAPRCSPGVPCGARLQAPCGHVRLLAIRSSVPRRLGLRPFRGRIAATDCDLYRRLGAQYCCRRARSEIGVNGGTASKHRARLGALGLEARRLCRHCGT